MAGQIPSSEPGGDRRRLGGEIFPRGLRPRRWPRLSKVNPRGRPRRAQTALAVSCAALVSPQRLSDYSCFFQPAGRLRKLAMHRQRQFTVQPPQPLASSPEQLAVRNPPLNEPPDDLAAVPTQGLQSGRLAPSGQTYLLAQTGLQPIQVLLDPIVVKVRVHLCRRRPTV